MLAGRIDEALPYLKRAAANCNVFNSPMASVRASLDLGRALEQKADTTAACDAYANVVARWGHAKPRSVSATAARARMAHLHCSAPR